MKPVHHPFRAAIVAAVLRVAVPLVGEGGAGGAEGVDAAAAVTPGPEVVILRAGADDLRRCPVVDEDHFVAFAPPVALILEYRLGDAHVMTASLGFEHDVVAGAVLIGPRDNLLVSVPLPVRGPAVVGNRLAVLGVEVRHIVRKAGMLLPVDVVVKAVDLLFPFVGDGDLRRLAERHREVAVQRLLRAYRKRSGFVQEVFSEAEAEEIADGSFHRRQRVAIPVHPQHDLL